MRLFLAAAAEDAAETQKDVTGANEKAVRAEEEGP